MGHKRRHHTVPRHFLKGFADGWGRISLHRLGADPVSVSIADALVRTNFYTVPDAAGNPSDVLEDLFGEVEAMCSGPIRRLAAGEELTTEERGNVASWLALQHLRGDDQRVMMSDVHEVVLKQLIHIGGRSGVAGVLEQEWGRPPTEDEVDEYWASVRDNDWKLEPQVGDHLLVLRESILPAARMFAARPWMVVHFERKTLGTSDTPVVLVPDLTDTSMFSPVGFGTASMVTVALDRRTGLFMGAPTLDERGRVTVHTPGNALMANTLNGLTGRHARTAVAHHPEDKPFEGVELPPARTRDIDSPWLK